MKLRPLLWSLAAAALAWHAPAAAQDVHLRGDDHTRAAQIAREVLQRNNYLRFDRDTVLPDSFRAPGDLLVVDADVRLAGQVAGTAVVLGGHLYLRPGSKVGGPIAVLGGGVYPSGRAEYGTIFESDPSSTVSVELGADSSLTAVIDPPPGPALLAPFPAFPTYERVNGLTLGAGATFNPLRVAGGPTLTGWVSYRKLNPDHWGGGARLLVPFLQGVNVTAELSRATRSNDVWARADMTNSISSALFGQDYRDYYDADRLSLLVARPIGKPLIAGESWLGPRVGVMVEEARSLSARDPWSLWGDLERVNPPVLQEQINSALAGAELHWVGRVSRFSVDAQVERGHIVGEVAGVDRDFTQLTAFGSYNAIALRTHTLRYYGRVMMPVDGNAAPPQRFGILGGIPTLPTEDIGALRGDHLVFVAGTYSIPFPRLVVWRLGSPSLELRHAVGAAWASGEDQEWVQNVGAGIVFPFVGVRVAVNPADLDRTRVYFSLQRPSL